jgi:hypothetical protein
MQRPRKHKNGSFEGDAMRAALGRNDVIKEVRSHQNPPAKPVPQYREEPEHEEERLNPMAERKRRAA